MRTSASLDRATDQLVDGAAETADVVVDALADVAHSAIDVAADVIGDSSEALAALSVTGVARRLKQPRALLVLLVVALMGVWLYRRLTDSEEADNDASHRS